MIFLRTIIALLIALSLCFGGEYADAFLENGVSARALAMANTVGALDKSITAFASNPAGLGYVRNPQFGLMYTSQFGLANHNYFGFALPFSQRSTGAIGWIRYGVDDIPLRPDILREVTDPAARRDSILALQHTPFDTFNDLEEAYYISFGYFTSKTVKLGWRYSRFGVEIPVGLNFKILHKKLYNVEGFGIGLDIGGRISLSGAELFDFSNIGRINIGYALRDVTGTLIFWNTKSQDKIRINPVLSFAYIQNIERYDLVLSFGVEKEYRYNDKFRYGFEGSYKNRLFVRTGLNNSGITTGLGLHFKVMKRLIELDYSFLKHELGATHRIGGVIGI
jgi:hypothetical protein